MPLEATATADAVYVQGDILVTAKDDIEIACVPDDLPQHIEDDITPLKTFEDTIRVKDLTAPTGVTIKNDPEDVLFSISEPISEEELAELDEAPEAAETEFETESGTDKSEDGEAKEGDKKEGG